MNWGWLSRLPNHEVALAEWLVATLTSNSIVMGMDLPVWMAEESVSSAARSNIHFKSAPVNPSVALTSAAVSRCAMGLSFARSLMICARAFVGRRHEDGLVEAAGTAQGGIELPGLIGGADDEDALVVAAQAVELAEELVHDVARLRVAHGAAIGREAVELVEDEDAGRVGARGLEDLVEVALDAAVVGIEDLVQADGEVVAAAPRRRWRGEGGSCRSRAGRRGGCRRRSCVP